ncbi:MAG: hypothetical protein MJZ17_10820 [Bacteroidales bacterium]|nr:hypothetical protein [Bacteroidales bacterium]
MNKILRYSLSGILAAGFCVGMWFLARETRSERVSLACRSLEITFRDSLEFVSKEDVRGFISNGYGAYLGQQLDSVNLGKIEKVLESQSAVLKSEAWVTDDGVLHVSITQRAPVVRFQNGEVGYYSDDRGFIFPLHPRYTADVPLVEGAIPIDADGTYKGMAATEKERRWMESVIALVHYAWDSPEWKGRFNGCRIGDNGDVILLPSSGKEEFIIGDLMGIEDKFNRIDKYYSHIYARKGDFYSIVNLKYKGQIICRTKDM